MKSYMQGDVKVKSFPSLEAHKVHQAEADESTGLPLIGPWSIAGLLLI